MQRRSPYTHYVVSCLDIGIYSDILSAAIYFLRNLKGFADSHHQFKIYLGYNFTFTFITYKLSFIIVHFVFNIYELSLDLV